MMFVDDLTTAHALWNHMPAGVLVIDADGAVRAINDRAVSMVGRVSADDVVGTSVFGLIVAADLAIVYAAVTTDQNFSKRILGPFRVRLMDGSEHGSWSECWAYEGPPELGYDAHIVVFTAESVADRMAAALRSLGANADLADTHDLICDAMTANPITARTAMLSVENGVSVGAAGDWPLDTTPDAASGEPAPWELCAAGGAGAAVLSVDLPLPWAESAARAEFGSVWVWPVDVDGERRAVMVMWRASTGAISANQRRCVNDAVDIARLSIQQDDYRIRLDEAAHRDQLTGVGNRARFDAVIESGDGPDAVLFVDLDEFKAVNDRHGHHAGDEVLRVVADRLARLVPANDQLFRIGGDEFVILAYSPSGSSPTEWAENLAEAVVDAVGQPIELDGLTVDIGASVGLAISEPGAHGETNALLRQADERLLDAKRSGKRQWRHRVPASHPCADAGVFT